MQLQENTLFANRYALQKLLGRGGFSEVWLAKDNWTHLLVALKVYAPGQGMDTNGLQEFCGELASVYDLHHQYLLKPQHVDTWENMPYLIMAYCAQGSCASRLGKMSENEMWKFIHDVASGLAYLHEKEVVHQDLKPANILIDDSGNYLITDFGVSTRARSTLRKSVVSSTAGGGTTAYMGPERFSRQPAPIKASDIWSFGAMCYELLEGEVPFGELGGGMQKSGAEIPALQAHVSDALKYTVTKMLQKETWDRPTAATFVEWAKNPLAIDIDYALLEEDHALTAPHTSPAKQDTYATQRFNTPPQTTTGHATQRFGTQPNEDTQGPLKLSISPASLHVPAEGGNAVVYVDASTNSWMVKELPKWAHFGKKIDNKFTLHFDKNDSGKTRECKMQVAASEYGETVSATLTISQASLPKSNKRVKWIAGILLCLMFIFAICAGINYQKEVRAINNNHDYSVAAFDDNVREADIDHIELLERALSNLRSIERYENDSKFKGQKVYSSKRNTLIQKTQNMYEEVDRKYRKAPAGTQTERRNYEKREKVEQIKARI
ncbi:MAG: protein kinase [Paludibacteraceae bacterium]